MFAATLLVLVAMVSFSQEEDKSAVPEYKDYKEPDQFYKFHKRSKVIGAWQINKLKEGALVVRLKTNKTLIDALIAEGKNELANEKIAETYIINKNTMMAYKSNFSFCKLYFMYSGSSDSLLKGTRSGIFLDTNLVINPAIEMKENFYLIAERDYAYNSSIGFVREDSATIVKETGNPVREMGVVIKNKYGHQLKPPFPYYVKDKTFTDFGLPYYVVATGSKEQPYVWIQSEDVKAAEKLSEQYPRSAKATTIKIKKQFSYKNLILITGTLNEEFEGYYKSSNRPEEAKQGPSIRPYLY